MKSSAASPAIGAPENRKAHHVAVAEDQTLQNRNILFDRSPQNQARRRQDDERRLFR
jgi:hypothetical protein